MSCRLKRLKRVEFNFLLINVFSLQCVRPTTDTCQSLFSTVDFFITFDLNILPNIHTKDIITQV
jgi:hypothetical protein